MSTHHEDTVAVPEGGPDGIPEISTLPEGVPDNLIATPTDDGVWRKVPKAPAAVIDTHPIEDAGDAVAPPPIPRAVKVGGIVAIAALLMVSGWIGLALGTPPTPSPSPTPTVKEWALQPPETVGKYVRGAVTTTEPVAAGGPTVTRADYADGTNSLYLILSRPETDIATYLADAGVESTHEIASTSCGVSVDTNLPVCARIADKTAIMLVGVSNQTQATLASQVGDFYDALRGEES